MKEFRNKRLSSFSFFKREVNVLMIHMLSAVNNCYKHKCKKNNKYMNTNIEHNVQMCRVHSEGGVYHVNILANAKLLAIATCNPIS